MILGKPQHPNPVPTDFHQCSQAPCRQSAETRQRAQFVVQSACHCRILELEGTWVPPGQSVQGIERKQRPKLRKLAAQVITESGLEHRLSIPALHPIHSSLLLSSLVFRIEMAASGFETWQALQPYLTVPVSQRCQRDGPGSSLPLAGDRWWR